MIYKYVRNLLFICSWYTDGPLIIYLTNYLTNYLGTQLSTQLYHQLSNYLTNYLGTQLPTQLSNQLSNQLSIYLDHSPFYFILAYSGRRIYQYKDDDIMKYRYVFIVPSTPISSF